MEPVVSIDNVSKHFENGQQRLSVLEDISVFLHPREIVCLVGKSGCGKTTILNLVAGLEKPSAGNISVTKPVAYVPQKEFFLPWRTILENVLLPLEISSHLTLEKRRTAVELLADKGLEGFIDSYPSELSGGMRQKCAFIRAMLQNAPVLLFDESFSAIDFDERILLARETRHYLHGLGKSAFFVTHNIEEAIAIGDRIVVFSQRPARILREITVTLSEKERNPVALRKNPYFAKLFAQIWAELKVKT